MSNRRDLPADHHGQTSAGCRALLYERVMAHLSDIDAAWLFAWEEAAHVSEGSYVAELERLRENIEAHLDAEEPTIPPEAVRRVIDYLREPSALDPGEIKGSHALLVAEEANRGLRAMCERIAKEMDPQVRAMCDRILGAIERELEAEGPLMIAGPPSQVPQRGLGRAIRGLREERGLSRDSLAERADLSEVELAQIEEGEADPLWGTVALIAAGLKVSLRHLSEAAEELEEVGD